MRVSLDKRPEEQVIELLHQPGGYEALGYLISIKPEKLTSAGRIDYLTAFATVIDTTTTYLSTYSTVIATSIQTLS